MAVSYKDSGVDIDTGDALIERIKPLARSTYSSFVVDGVGGFASLCALPPDIEHPLLVSGTDGVGTKLKIAFAANRHDTIGQDLVAMCVNDVLTTGARPLFFLDYFGCGKLDLGVAEAVISGIAKGCSIAECALIGGETAELPGMYAPGEYDLAGFAVGVVSRTRVLGKQRVRPGDDLVAVASSGLHSNGFSLVRRILIDEHKLSLDAQVAELGRTLADELLTPTKIYTRAVRELSHALGDGLHALCHITGGGIVGNLPRILPKGCTGRVRMTHEVPPIFRLIQQKGPVESSEMQRAFNLGIGLVAIVENGEGASAVKALERAGERAWALGIVTEGQENAEPSVIFE